MAAKIATLVLAGTLLVPFGLDAQATSTRPTPRTSTSTDEAQVFFGALRTIRDYHSNQVGDSVLWEKAIDGLIKELDDPYAAVFTPSQVEEFREETTGDYAGIGVQISGLDNAITITIVFPNTPADQMGLLVGDRIVGVDGESTEGWSTADASDNIRGEPGTTVDVSIGRDGLATPIRYTIERNNVHVASVRSAFIQDSIAYIVVDRIARGSAREVDDAISSLEGAKGVVVDLRRNPGGYLDESLLLADLFLPVGQNIASTRNRAVREQGESREEYGARIPPRMEDTPIVILVDRYTASAAEIISGALQDHDRAVVLGERTFGKGVVQTLLPLPAGRQIRITTGAWYTPLGRSLHRSRTRGGELLPEDADALPVYLTDGGRTVKGGGGVFPDLAVQDDTLTIAERELFNAAGRAEVPLNLRIAERALETAKTSLADDTEPVVTANEMSAFIDGLLTEGIPSDAIEAPGVRDYLSWRVRMDSAERANRLGLALTHRMERDRVLSLAVDMLSESPDQNALFARVDTERGLQQASTQGTGRSGPSNR